MPTTLLSYPHFYPQFRCTGPACRDNCCHDWPIEIDKAHYLQYRSVKDPDFAALCGKYLHPIKKDASADRYGRLSLDEQGRCGFQDEDGGCRLIRLLGEQHLSRTCALYPRRKGEFQPGQWELSLSMSCEEAVRIGVLEPERVEIRQERRDLAQDDPMLLLPSVGIGPRGQVQRPPVWGSTLRTVCLTLLQTRELDIPTRLTAILLLLRRLDKCMAAGREEEIPLETLRFLQAVESGGMADFFRNLTYDRAAHLAALQLPMAHLLAGRQAPIVQDFLKLLDPHLTPTETGLHAGIPAAEALLKEIRDRADPFLEKYSRWTENYLVNLIYSALFPFLYRTEGLSLEGHGYLLLHQYGLLRCLLAAADPTLPPEQSFTRAAVHVSRLTQHTPLASDLHKLRETLHLPQARMLWLAL